jgi:putative colanic acid biosynthesis acetyltransferase WcaF
MSVRQAYRWRALILRIFGARAHPRSRFRHSVVIDRPWNIEADALTMIGDGVVLRAQAPIRLGARCVVSQHALLSTERRDPRRAGCPTTAAPITIEDDCWIATDTLLLGGAIVRQGSVVGARSMVEGEIPPWTVATGEPAVARGPRVLSPPAPTADP